MKHIKEFENYTVNELNKSTLLNAADKARDKGYYDLAGRFKDHSKSEYSTEDQSIIEVKDVKGLEYKINLDSLKLNLCEERLVTFGCYNIDDEYTRIEFTLDDNRKFWGMSINDVKCFITNRKFGRLLMDKVKSILRGSGVSKAMNHDLTKLSERSFTKGY